MENRKLFATTDSDVNKSIKKILSGIGITIGLVVILLPIITFPILALALGDEPFGFWYILAFQAVGIIIAILSYRQFHKN